MRPVPSRQVLRHLCRTYYQANESLPSASKRPSLRETKQCPSWTCRQSSRPFCSSIRGRFSTTALAQADQQDQPGTTLPDITNYYTLFPTTIPDGPPMTNTKSPFKIPLPALRKEFLRLQSLHHPDKHDPSTPGHQKALALSSLINNAYKTLSDPLLRAQYLLQLNYDVDVTSEDNSSHPTDQETLMEVMEAQERIEEAESQEDIDALKSENEERIRNTTDLMSAAFEGGDVDAAKSECVRLKYWRSLQQGLHDWEPGKEVRLIH